MIFLSCSYCGLLTNPVRGGFLIDMYEQSEYLISPFNSAITWITE